MKKLLKPKMEFIKFNTEDVITTSGGDTYFMNSNKYSDTDADKKNTQDYGGLDWNLNK